MGTAVGQLSKRACAKAAEKVVDGTVVAGGGIASRGLVIAEQMAKNTYVCSHDF